MNGWREDLRREDGVEYLYLKEAIKASIKEALLKLGLPYHEAEPVEPPSRELGDLSSSVALALSRSINERPIELAYRIADALKAPNLVERVEVHPPGYINFFVDYPSFSYALLNLALRGEMLKLLPRPGEGKRAILEHTSVNPNKALHIGHVRNLVLGDTLRRLLELAGYRVQVINYIDDSGPQVADLLVGFLTLKMPISPPPGKKFDEYCGDDVYVKVNKLYEEDPRLLGEQRKLLRELEDPSSEASSLAKKITKRILDDQLKTCWRLGARYDLLCYESLILEAGLWEELFTLMKEKGIAELVRGGKYEGCWVMRVPGEAEGEEKVLVRSDGTVTYLAKDIPFAAWKLGLLEDPFTYRAYCVQPDGTQLLEATLNAKGGRAEPDGGKLPVCDVAITLIDARQSRLQRMVGYALGKLFGDEVGGRYRHLAYGLVGLSKRSAELLGFRVEEEWRIVQMSGRKGLYINADRVLEALHEHALKEAEKRNPHETPSGLKEMAERIAIGALRFDMLKQDLDKTISFDMERILELKGETGPYLQYSYARATRIIEKGERPAAVTLEGCRGLNDGSERLLVWEVGKLGYILSRALERLSPKEIALYSYSLCEAFNNFYEKRPVLQEPHLEVRRARLALVIAFHTTLGLCLDLMGIPRAERL